MGKKEEAVPLSPYEESQVVMQAPVAAQALAQLSQPARVRTILAIAAMYGITLESAS